MDTGALQSIGMTDAEIRVYLALIKLGPSTTGPIVDESHVASSKIYHILEKLLEKGIVSFIVKKRTKYYQAADPVSIMDFVEKKEDELQHQKNAIQEIIPVLQEQMLSQQNPSEAQIFKGHRGIQTIIEKVYARLKKGETFYDIGIPSFQKERYHAYWQEEDHPKRVELGIQVKALFNKDTPKQVLKDRNAFWGCDARYMPIDVDTPAWILIYKDVSVIILQSDNPLAIEITNQQIADSFMGYFNAFWRLSKPFQ